VPEQRREVRHEFRTRLAWAGFGSLGGGLWITPQAEREAELAVMSPNGSVAELLSLTAELGRLGGPERIVSEAWDLSVVATGYREFTARFERLRPKTPVAVFRAQTQLVHEWRKFPFLAPDLPERVLPAEWPRRRAHDVFHQRHAMWHETAQTYFETLEGVSERSAGWRADRV
jgi:phenylacetic acid degradation operon negative regulatory protein